MSRGVHAVGSGTSWDSRRNTSQVQEVAPDALPNALRSLAALRRDQPALVRWLEDGHPNLTEAQHVARFGEPYKRQARRSNPTGPQG